MQTRAERDGDEWVVHGQKVWTSLAHWAQWIFVLCRTNRDAPKHKGLSYLLMPMDQPGIEIRPIVQITGHSEFNETFFDGARTASENVVGEVDGGWRVAMGTLAFERGASTLGQQLSFENELQEITALARANGLAADPVFRQRLADAWITLRDHALPRAADAADDGDRNRHAGRRRSTSCSGRTSTARSASSRSTCSARRGIAGPDGDRFQRLFLYCAPTPSTAARTRSRRM